MKMDDATLLNQIEVLERQAVGYFSGEIAADQAKAMDYYLSQPFGTEEEGRSQVVSSDVWDVVEGMTPMVLKPFVSSDEVVTFKPFGPEDEEAAKQETEYINYVVTQRNDMFEQLVAWVKTGLLQKNGIVKYWWDKSTKTEIERYEGLSDDVYTALIAEKNIKVIEHTETAIDTVDPMGNVVQELVHDVVIRVSREEGQAKYEVVPPEEILIGRDARSINPKAARFFQHRRKMTISEIREMGYDVEDDVADDGDDNLMSEVYNARRNSEENEGLNQSEMLDPSTREVLFRETFLCVDFDGDGIAELRKVCAVGKEILSNEEAEEINFCAWTPYQQPFKFYGRCPADETTEIQLIKSAVLRQTMDNIYTINNNRNFVSNKVNLDDLLDNQIAGIVRVDGDVVGNHVVPAPVTPIGQITMPIIEYFDGAKENRTGFSRYNQGAADLGNQKTLGEVQIVSEQSGQRVELIARAFAETGLRSLMLGIHGLCRRHATKAETIRLRGKWVEVDPRSWKTRYDMSVSVGLGNADKQMQLQGAQMLLGQQMQLAAVPGLVSPENFYNASAKLASAIGEKDADKFFTNPAKKEPQEPPDPMEDPAFILEVKKIKQKDREINIKEREATLSAEKAAAELALKAEQQGHNMEMQVLEALARMQQQVEQTGQAVAKLQMQSQQQAHSQGMAEASHELSAQQAMQAMQEPANGQA